MSYLPSGSLESRRRGQLSHFTRLANEFESYLWEADPCDDSVVENYFAALADAFEKYVDVHERVMCDWSIPSEKYQRLKEKHATIVHRYSSLCNQGRAIVSEAPPSQFVPPQPTCQFEPPLPAGQAADSVTAVKQAANANLGCTQLSSRAQSLKSLSLRNAGNAPRAANVRFEKGSCTSSKSRSVRNAEISLARAQVRLAELELEQAEEEREERASVDASERTQKWVEEQVEEQPTEVDLGRRTPHEEAVRFREKSSPTISSPVEGSRLRAGAAPWQPPLPSQHSDVGTYLSLLVSLPKPTLQVFDGDATEFVSFQSNFETHVGAQNISSSLKLSFLLQYCDGKAKEAIKDCVVLPPESGYEEAWKILTEHYGKPHVIARKYLESLTNGPSISMADVNAVRALAQKMYSCELALRKINYSANLDSDDTLNKIAMRLPKPCRVKWVERSASIIKKQSRNPTFGDLSAFVAERAEVAASPHSCILSEPKAAVKQKTALVSISQRKDRVEAKQPALVSKKVLCSLCNGDHPLNRCPKFQAMSVEQRWSEAKRLKICYNCLDAGHFAKRCLKPPYCKDCTTKHSKLLHRATSTKTDEQSKAGCATVADSVPCDSDSDHFSVAHTRKESSTVSLQVLKVVVNSGETSLPVYALLDQCSNVTLCSRFLLDKLRIKGRMKPASINMSTVSGSSKIETSCLRLSVSNPNGKGETITLPRVYCLERLPCAPKGAPSLEITQRWEHLKDLEFPTSTPDQIHLLIGADNPSAFRVIETREGNPGDPYAVHYPLGWTVIGPLDHHQSQDAVTHFIDGQQELEEQMMRIWDMEFADQPSSKRALSVEDKRALSIMESTAYLDGDGHWCIRLPWRTDPPPLHNNRTVAEHRLSHLKKKLDSDPEMRESYKQKLNSYIEDGFAVPSNDEGQGAVWYVTHHAVIHPQKKKLRVVFDCSAKYNGTSLNEQLLQGPDFLNSLVGVIMRFREDRVAIAADIEGMFHQVRVHESDQNALRFLWNKDGDLNRPIDYQMTVHLFGATSSPSVCCFALRNTVRHHACHTDTARTVERNFYMDDLLKSTSTVQEALVLQEDLASVLKKGGFRLTKWISNRREVVEKIPATERAEAFKDLTDELPTERALGLLWSTEDDVLMFRSAVKDQSKLTRRSVLSEVSRLYDPCGFAAPVIILGKKMLQELCALKWPWDDGLPDRILKSWMEWRSGLPSLEQISVPRCFKSEEFGEVREVQVHVFCDASEVAYAVAAYLRLVDMDGRICVSFIMGKARLAPLKTVSIPRLELCAAALGAKMLLFIKEEIDLKIDDVFMWTDSMAVLKYIASTKRRFKVFVANRLSMIHEITSVHQWRHVPSASNPADLGSRGIMPSEVHALKSVWLCGPSFLQEEEGSWPTTPLLQEVTAVDIEVKKVNTSFTVAGDANVFRNLIDRHSSWSRLRRVTAWVIRFVNQLKDKKARGPLTLSELKCAEEVLIKTEQEACFEEYRHLQQPSVKLRTSSRLIELSPYVENGILRVGGRLARSSLPMDMKHQAILPADSHLSELLIRYYHVLHNHAGVNLVLTKLREKYWILKAKSAIKKVIRKGKGGCVICKRFQQNLQTQVMADLPAARVSKPDKPFSYVGVDFFGPILVKFKRGKAKRYGCIFTCLSCRAVHLEITHSLDTDSFLAAFQRFVARRGRPKEVFSDNGTNLVAGAKELKKCIKEWNASKLADHFTKEELIWHFNPPTASHFGGVWESLIRSVRRILVKLLGEQVVSDETLLTIMAEVEKTLNDRPLWSPSDDPKDEQPLSPAHFLLLQSSPLPMFQALEPSRRWWKQANYLSEIFWKRWLKNYLPELQKRRKWSSRKDNLSPGDIVLVAEPTCRGQWPLALVTQVHPDENGVVRVVSVKFRGKVLQRPIHKLCLLEEV